MKLTLIICGLGLGLIGASAMAAEPGEELVTAARRGQLAEVRRLLEAGAPLEAKNQYGATPLYMAVFNAHGEVAKLLLEKGANPNVEDTFYKSSIFAYALQKKQTEVVRLMLDKGVTVNQRGLLALVGLGDKSAMEKALTRQLPTADLTAALQAALEAKKDDLAGLLRAAGAAEPKVVTVPPAVLTSYIGTYASPALPISIAIVVDGGSLFRQSDGQPRVPVAAVTENEFRLMQG